MNNPNRARLLGELQYRLNYTFKSPELLEAAITHRSAKKSNKGQDYEQLEFIGDAVLDLAVAHLLLKNHPKKNEGELSKMRAALVNTESLAQISRELSVGLLINMSQSEQNSGGAEKNSILADVVEALFGAIYFEAGFSRTFEVVRLIFDARTLKVKPKDPKTELQEKLHALSLPSPEYVVEDSSGPDHAPIFSTVVKVNEEICGRGSGNSKKASEQAAALEALKNIAEQNNG